MRRLVPLLAAPVLLLGLAAPAHAAKSDSRSDPRDAASVLDLKKASLRAKGPSIVATITTWDAFGDADLAVPSGLGLDFKVSSKTVRGVLVSVRDGKVRASICSYRLSGSPETRNCSRVQADRVSSRAVRVVIPRARIAKGATVYRWRAGSFAMDGQAGCTTSPFCLDSTASKPSQFHTWRL